VARSLVIQIASRHEWTARSLESILAPRGYVVRKAFTRADTLSQLHHEPPDAVIVDDLADADAPALCRELREGMVVTPSTPVFLLLTRPATRRDRLAAWRAGAWACLGDPLDQEELLAVLAAFLPAKLDADQARTDGLLDEATGVYNVRGVTRRARELAAQASRHHAALGCVLIAPDTVESLNGSTDEDQLLQRIASTLKATARLSDAIGRLGPTAFIILAVDTDAAQARRLGERLAQAIQATGQAGESPAPPIRLFGGCHGVDRCVGVDAARYRRARPRADRAWRVVAAWI
jgi:diguanylate cyclase (GGDEF)-like protein